MKLAIKYCGLTRNEDIQAAIESGVDAIGLVFYPPSPRAVSVEQAAALARQIPAFVSVVALVVNMDEHQLQQLAQNVAFDVIQFHGDESPQRCAELAALANKRWIKALRVNADTDDAQSLLACIEAYRQAGASSILLDAYHSGQYGGTGERFDWSLIPENSPLPVILAGGLTPENVAQVQHLPIYGVDVSGGIEAQKGIKDHRKMHAFAQVIQKMA